MSNEFEKDTISVISEFRGRLADEWVNEYISLAQHNEYGIALENLCEQLFEFGIFPTQDELGRIASLANAMGLDKRRWQFLEKS